MEFSPGHNFQSVEASDFKLYIQIDNRKSALCKNHNSFLFNYQVIALYKIFYMDFCPGHNFQSIEASNFKLQR